MTNKETAEDDEYNLVMLTLYKFLKFLFRHIIPKSLRYPLVRAIAYGVCLFNAPRRRVIVGNLTPIVGPKRACAMAPKLLGNFLMTAVDFFCPRGNLTQETVIHNWSVFEKTYRKTHRVMLVTAHLGNWELGISCLVDKGYSVAGVYAPYRKDAIVQWILSHRNSDVEWIPSTRGAAEACLAAVQKGRVLGMVGDIPFGEKGRRVQIAGHTARLPLGPWAIAVRAQAVVLPAFIIREAPGRYRGIIHDPIIPPGGSLRRQIENMQEIYRSYLERYIQTYPTQWGVLQPFWET